MRKEVLAQAFGSQAQKIETPDRTELRIYSCLFAARVRYSISTLCPLENTDSHVKLLRCGDLSVLRKTRNLFSL